MNQIDYKHMLQSLDINEELKQLQDCSRYQVRLLEIRTHGALWEISPPNARNMYTVRTNFGGQISALSVHPPKVDELIRDYDYMRKSANRPITEVIPNGTLLIFATMHDASKYMSKACGELYREYSHSNFITPVTKK